MTKKYYEMKEELVWKLIKTMMLNHVVVPEFLMKY